MRRGQKFLLFLLVFAGTVGVLQVDGAYSNMMDREGTLSLELRRVDEENIRISAFGGSKEINGAEVAAEWERIQAGVTDTLDRAALSARRLLGLSDKQSDTGELLRQAVFPVQTL